ncbi:hypothetical protein COV82_06120 [Candidatus Peregrinibacteria bacterium CG11_big_fil_rev_8_21_14_0_20_46_8]|nr:MAG: hypothetical protein COV82_06120 [Candidatus Peregrinibacteria bacterium CG11_big_fil_rev_8_21_14_0_20_46_8]
MGLGYSKKVKFFFGAIAFVAFCGAFFMGSFLQDIYPDWYKLSWLALLFMLPLVIHAVVAFGFSQQWFDMQEGTSIFLIRCMQISVRVFALFAMFDLIMRVSQRTAWMLKSITPFIGDAAWILLLILWTAIQFVLPPKLFKS